MTDSIQLTEPSDEAGVTAREEVRLAARQADVQRNPRSIGIEEGQP